MYLSIVNLTKNEEDIVKDYILLLTNNDENQLILNSLNDLNNNDWFINKSFQIIINTIEILLSIIRIKEAGDILLKIVNELLKKSTGIILKRESLLSYNI